MFLHLGVRKYLIEDNQIRGLFIKSIYDIFRIAFNVGKLVLEKLMISFSVMNLRVSLIWDFDHLSVAVKDHIFISKSFED